jgi:hypothetical protein
MGGIGEERFAYRELCDIVPKIFEITQKLLTKQFLSVIKKRKEQLK